jgi:hypothetical protein
VRGADERWNNDPSIDPDSNFGTCVDIYAPAHHFQHLASMQCDTCYRTTAFFLSGTSYAAPVVTGMVARLLQKDPWRTPQQVWDYIRDTAAGPACFAFDANGNCRSSKPVTSGVTGRRSNSLRGA